MQESTFPPLSLLKEAQGSEEVQTVQVIVDSQLQQIVLRDVEEVLENKTGTSMIVQSHWLVLNLKKTNP